MGAGGGFRFWERVRGIGDLLETPSGAAASPPSALSTPPTVGTLSCPLELSSQFAMVTLNPKP